MSKLYPPYINGTIPAFYKAYDAQNIAETEGTVITVPFTMNNSVGLSSVDGFVLRIKTVQSGVYLCAPIYTDNFDPETNEAYFRLPISIAQLLNEGQFYKVQIAYYQGKPIEANTGYFSTVGVTKCVSKPIVSIDGFESSSVNLFSNEYLGIYDVSEGRDQSEKVYSYQFTFYNDEDNIVYTTGEVIHNSSNDTDYSYSLDNITVNDFAQDNKTYSVQYTITTMNGLVISSPRYKLTTEKFVAPARNITVIPSMNFDNGYVILNFMGEQEAVTTDIVDHYEIVNGKKEPVYKIEYKEIPYYGEFLVTRAGEDDDYSVWSELFRFRLDNEKPSTIVLKDFTIEQGYKYKYALQQYNIFGIYSSRITTNEIQADFEDAFLFDGERHLKIRFNPTMNSFKTEIPEKKVDTIGSQYPFIFRNGKGYYKTFPLGGLLSFQMDEEQLFLEREIIEGERWNMYKDEPYNPTRYKDLGSDTDPSMKNFFKERIFKLAVLDWLNDGKPKLFKSPSEGNYIVRLMKVSLKPEQKLGRMIHSFSSTAYEVADANYTNLLKYGFLKVSEPSDYVPLWKTFDLEKGYERDKDIEIAFDESLISFIAEDMNPGDRIEVHYKGGGIETIYIGVTGSFNFQNNDQIITKLIIPAIRGRKQVGTISCYFKTTRMTEFDAITNIKLVTYVNKQFVGVDPRLLSVHQYDYVEGQKEDTVRKLTPTVWQALQKTNLRDWLGKSMSDTDLVLSVDAQKAIADYEIGDIATTINTTIYDGKVDKVQLLNLEQAHFHLRDVIPVYAYDPNKEIVDNSWSYARPTDYATTPFGKPYPLRELVKHELQDPFCIYEAFEWIPAGIYYIDSQWDPNQTYYRKKNGEFVLYETVDEGEAGGAIYAKGGKFPTEAYYRAALGTSQLDQKPFARTAEAGWVQPYYSSDLSPVAFTGEGQYYDAYWDYWSSDYDPTFYVNDKYNYVKIVGTYYDENGSAQNFCDFKGNSAIGFYYESNGEKVPYDPNNLYIYDDKQFKQITSFEKVPPQSGTYYIRIPNQINLTEIRDKSLYNLGKIDTLRIGNGVMMEGTFQLKVIDYYTEDNDKDVKTAKDEYLKRSAFLKRILSVYEVLQNADKAWQKYQALKNVYAVILNGKWDSLNGAKPENPVYSEHMIQTDVDKINELLNDVEELALMELMDDQERTDIDDACATVDPDVTIEGLSAKLAQLNIVIADLIVRIDALEKQISEEKEAFAQKQSDLATKISDYNYIALRYRTYSWLAKLFGELDTRDLTLDQIASHYKVVYNQLQGIVAENKNNLLNLATKCAEFYSSIKTILNRIKIYFEIQNDRDDDENLDGYIDTVLGELFANLFIYDQEVRLIDKALQPQKKELTDYVFADFTYTSTTECQTIHNYLISTDKRIRANILLGVENKFTVADDAYLDLSKYQEKSDGYRTAVINYCVAVDDLYGLSLIKKSFGSSWDETKYQKHKKQSDTFQESMSYEDATIFNNKRKMVPTTTKSDDPDEVIKDFFVVGKFDSAIDWDILHSQKSSTAGWIVISIEQQEEVLKALELINSYLENAASFIKSGIPTGFLDKKDTARDKYIDSDISYTLLHRTSFLGSTYSAKAVYQAYNALIEQIKGFNSPYISERYNKMLAHNQEGLFALIDEYPLKNNYYPEDKIKSPELNLPTTINFKIEAVEGTKTENLPDDKFSIVLDSSYADNKQPQDVRGYVRDNNIYTYFGYTAKDENNQEIGYGVIYWYIQLEIEAVNEVLRKQYTESLTLRADYEKRINNYETKRLKYLQEYNANLAIYKAYEGTEEMSFYKSTYTAVDPADGRIIGLVYYINDPDKGYVAFTDDRLIDNWFRSMGKDFNWGTGDGKQLYIKTDERIKKLNALRKEVLELWYKFVNILDVKYTSERDRGLYVV